jgi:inward rectifier potassium channel
LVYWVLPLPQDYSLEDLVGPQLLKFSHNAVIAPWWYCRIDDSVNPFKNTNFTDAEAKITLGMSIEEDGKMVNKFYSLDLELEKMRYP